MKKIICIVGRTGSGKDSLTYEICQKYNLKQLISYTTRPKRDQEGNTHIFIDEKDFEKYKDDIVAYTEINGYKYFCTKDQIYNNDIYIIDPEGIKKLQKTCPEIKLIIINIFVPENIRKDRAINIRHDDLKIWENRNKNESSQFDIFENQNQFRYRIINLDFQESIYKLEKILKKEGII